MIPRHVHSVHSFSSQASWEYHHEHNQLDSIIILSDLPVIYLSHVSFVVFSTSSSRLSDTNATALLTIHNASRAPIDVGPLVDKSLSRVSIRERGREALATLNSQPSLQLHVVDTTYQTYKYK